MNAFTAIGRAPNKQTVPAEPSGDAPTALTARSFTGDVLPLGLDRPLALRGRDAFRRSALPLALPFGWTDEVIRTVREECAEMEARSAPWFTMRPIAICAPPGSGRTHVARQLARHAGLPFSKVNLSAPDAGRLLGRAATKPEICVPSAPVLAMAASGCANPVIMLTGLEAAPPDVIASAARMVDPRSSGRWVEEAIGATIDLSHVNWILQCDNPGVLPSHLAASIRTARMFGMKSDERSISLIAEAMADRNVDRLTIGEAEHLLRYLKGRPMKAAYPAALNWVAAYAGHEPPF